MSILLTHLSARSVRLLPCYARWFMLICMASGPVNTGYKRGYGVRPWHFTTSISPQQKRQEPRSKKEK